jgi:hypothetical protein
VESVRWPMRAGTMRTRVRQCPTHLSATVPRTLLRQFPRTSGASVPPHPERVSSQLPIDLREALEHLAQPSDLFAVLRPVALALRLEGALVVLAGLRGERGRLA